MKKKVISFHYTVMDKSGKKIDSSQGQEPMLYMEGAGQIIPGLESALKGAHKGDKKKVFVLADEAYGRRNETLVVEVARGELPQTDSLEVGHQFRSESPEGHSQIFTVTNMTKSHVTLDGNHPLADQDLNFEVEIMDVRDATDEEMKHGHAHGPGHHHHH